MNAWLIEYVGAKPIPMYVPEDFAVTDGFYTPVPWKARRFDSKELAEQYLVGEGYCEPWTAVQHGFSVTCMYCHKETGTWSTLCDDCIPF